MRALTVHATVRYSHSLSFISLISAPASPRLSVQHPNACRRVLTSKSALATGQDKSSDGIVCVELLERSIELVEERGTERVERLGAVERDERDAVGGARGEDVLVLRRRHEADAEERGGAGAGESAGAGICFADVTVAAFLKWLRKLLPEEEWAEVMAWDGGRWARFMDVFAPHEVEDVGGDVEL